MYAGTYPATMYRLDASFGRDEAAVPAAVQPAASTPSLPAVLANLPPETLGLSRGLERSS